MSAASVPAIDELVRRDGWTGWAGCDYAALVGGLRKEAADIRARLDKGLPHEVRRDSVARLFAVYRELNRAAAAPKEV
ncbi:MAG: hypothetical protein L0227_02845 [Chloroflexi bacterium]|nr:hypothetical protein [Chloroflexota bacterium]